MSIHAFDAAVALEPDREGQWRGHTSPAYANMIGPFGGITAAQALNAVMQHPQRRGEPVALTVNFAAAMADGPFEVHARPARTNRSTQHWIVEIRQAGEVMVTATAFTAVRRETWGSTSEVTMPDAPAPQDVPAPNRRGRVEWTHRYDLRFIEGDFPAAWDAADHGDSRTRLWMRDVPERPLDFLSLAAMCDIFFPRIWRRRASFVPIGTVSMTVYFHTGSEQLAATGSGYLQGRAQAQAFFNGYFDHTAQVWNERGELLATTQQIVYYKE